MGEKMKPDLNDKEFLNVIENITCNTGWKPRYNNHGGVTISNESWTFPVIDGKIMSPHNGSGWIDIPLKKFEDAAGQNIPKVIHPYEQIFTDILNCGHRINIAKDGDLNGDCIVIPVAKWREIIDKIKSGDV